MQSRETYRTVLSELLHRIELTFHGDWENTRENICEAGYVNWASQENFLAAYRQARVLVDLDAEPDATAVGALRDERVTVYRISLPDGEVLTRSLARVAFHLHEAAETLALEQRLDLSVQAETWNEQALGNAAEWDGF